MQLKGEFIREVPPDGTLLLLALQARLPSAVGDLIISGYGKVGKEKTHESETKKEG